ncbi:hypothetical protein M9435_000351 [Picochlorum sp. BPE23]|nr:hypothetical protein M9435_000351 [Picochlorum sp. BPE23]
MVLRVVSLLPSATDTVVALEKQLQLLAEGQSSTPQQRAFELVGCSHECDVESLDASHIPVLTSNRIGDSIPIEEIQNVFSASVAAIEEMQMLGAGLAMPLLQYGLSVYHLEKIDTLRELKPDVILTCLQTAHSCILEGELCACAFESVLGYEPRVVHCNGQTLDSIYDDMQRIADALDVSTTGQEIVASMKENFETARQVCQGRGHPNVACIQWPNPLMTCGAWVPEILEMIGARVVAGDQGPGGTIEPDAMATADTIVFALCGLGLDVSEKCARTVVSSSLSKKNRRSEELPQRRIAIMDGVRMLSRPGPLLQASWESLIEILYAEVQPFGNHRGIHWRYL